MDDKTMWDLIINYEKHSLVVSDIKVVFQSQFKAMLGSLGNFFIGERMFSVVMQQSIEMERKAGELDAERLKQGDIPEKPLP